MYLLYKYIRLEHVNVYTTMQFGQDAALFLLRFEANSDSSTWRIVKDKQGY